jgi:hypothetical protein
MAKLSRAVGAFFLLAGGAVSEALVIEAGCGECEYSRADPMRI